MEDKKKCVCLFGFDVKCRQTTAHHQCTQKRPIHKRAFQPFEQQFHAKRECAAAIGMQRMRVIQAFVKRGGAENGGADALQRTGADETGRLPDEIGILFSTAEGALPSFQACRNQSRSGQGAAFVPQKPCGSRADGMRRRRASARPYGWTRRSSRSPADRRYRSKTD